MQRTFHRKQTPRMTNDDMLRLTICFFLEKTMSADLKREKSEVVADQASGLQEPESATSNGSFFFCKTKPKITGASQRKFSLLLNTFLQIRFSLWETVGADLVTLEVVATADATGFERYFDFGKSLVGYLLVLVAIMQMIFNFEWAVLAEIFKWVTLLQAWFCC